MGDLLGSLTKPHTVVVRWLNGDNIGWKGTRGAQWRALDLVLRGGVNQTQAIFIHQHKQPSIDKQIEDYEVFKSIFSKSIYHMVNCQGFYGFFLEMFSSLFIMFEMFIFSRFFVFLGFEMIGCLKQYISQFVLMRKMLYSCYCE